jgi:hypothetical protein
MKIPDEATVASLHQPHYFPWLGLIAKIACSDVFIQLDDVQFEKRGWQNRARYSSSEGLKFLTIPVLQKGLYLEERKIRDIALVDARATTKHWRTLVHRYGKRPGWPLVADRLEQILTAKHERLISLCDATTKLTLDVFHVRPKIVPSSEVAAAGMKGDRVVDLVRKVGASHYLSGTGAKTYLEEAAFSHVGLGLIFQEFTHPVYEQSTGRPFEPAAFALEWFIEEPDRAVETFHAHLRANADQPPRCIA